MVRIVLDKCLYLLVHLSRVRFRRRISWQHIRVCDGTLSIFCNTYRPINWRLLNHSINQSPYIFTWCKVRAEIAITKAVILYAVMSYSYLTAFSHSVGFAKSCFSEKPSIIKSDFSFKWNSKEGVLFLIIFFFLQGSSCLNCNCLLPPPPGPCVLECLHFSQIFCAFQDRKLDGAQSGMSSLQQTNICHNVSVPNAHCWSMLTR